MSTTRGPGRPAGALLPRREQLIDVTIELVAAHGYGAATLGRIATAAGLTKASVLHHFPSLSGLVAAAYDHVLEAVVAEVGGAVDDAAPQDAPRAYVVGMVGYFLARPSHTRMLTEALVHDAGSNTPKGAAAVGGADAGRIRWAGLARVLELAREARGLPPTLDLRTAAIVVGGGIDAILAERLRDAQYDGADAARQLADAVEVAYLTKRTPGPPR